jgi:hypothetical protein
MDNYCNVEAKTCLYPAKARQSKYFAGEILVNLSVLIQLGRVGVKLLEVGNKRVE